MRTSHFALRKRIENEKLNITDEQLFASNAYAAYLTDLAEAASKRYKRSIKVKTYWDDSENADIACTDNRRISINAGNHITQSFPTRRLRADSMVGLNGHEIGHVLFTDFTMANLYTESMMAGRFYPSEPEDLSIDESFALSEFKQFVSDGDDIALRAITMAAHNLDNILEDIYIEARMCEAFPGTFRTGILLNNIRMMELVPTLTEQVGKGYLGFSILCNLLIQYCRSGDVNNLTGYKGEYLDKLVECIPVVDEALYDADSRTRYAATNRILLIAWKYVKAFIEEFRKKSEEDMAQALGNQIAGNSSIPSGKGKAVTAGKFKFDKNSLDEEMNELQEVVAQETGRIELEKTDDIDEGENPGTSYDNYYTGSGYTSAEEDMNRILTEIAEESVSGKMEDELTAELQAEADSIRYGNAHKGIHVTVHRIRSPEPSLCEAYAKVSPNLLLISKRMQQRLLDILKDKKEGCKQTNLLMGRRLNSRAFAKDDGRYFYNNRLPEESLDMAVALLVDESGSMSSADRITHARAASIVLYDFCSKLGIPVIVYGHTSSGIDTDVFAYAEFDSPDKKDAYRIMDMSARWCNRDGAALRFVAERLMTREEQTKLLILISDGQPAASGYSGTEAEADLRGIKHEYTNKGITMFSAAIGDDKDTIERIYKDGFLDISDLNKLPMNLTRLISRYVEV